MKYYEALLRAIAKEHSMTDFDVADSIYGTRIRIAGMYTLTLFANLSTKELAECFEVFNTLDDLYSGYLSLLWEEAA